ncbi:MAG: hypothetical protein ACE5JU_25255 [Candidatus Binatia bacterium]
MAERFTATTPGSVARTTKPQSLHETGQQLWGPVRSVLQENFSFGDIKIIVGTTGFDMGRLAHLEQKPTGGATKSQLLSAVDQAYAGYQEEGKWHFVGTIMEEMLQRQKDLTARLEEVLSRVGWSIVEGHPLPRRLLDGSELQEIPTEGQLDMIKAASRFRDQDLSGTISAACGAVDSVTGRIYKEQNLGDPAGAAFQERVTRSITASGVLNAVETDLISIGWDKNRAERLIQNLRGSLNQATYVMQTLRSDMGDVHGSKTALRSLVFDSLQLSKLIVGLLRPR